MSHFHNTERKQTKVVNSNSIPSAGFSIINQQADNWSSLKRGASPSWLPPPWSVQAQYSQRCREQIHNKTAMNIWIKHEKSYESFSGLTFQSWPLFDLCFQENNAQALQKMYKETHTHIDACIYIHKKWKDKKLRKYSQMFNGRNELETSSLSKILDQFPLKGKF